MMQLVKLTDNPSGIRCNACDQVRLIGIFGSKTIKIAGPDKDDEGVPHSGTWLPLPEAEPL